MTTQRQKRAVAFCESMCDVEFQGDINDFLTVSAFLSEHLDYAKEVADECMGVDWAEINGYD